MSIEGFTNFKDLYIAVPSLKVFYGFEFLSLVLRVQVNLEVFLILDQIEKTPIVSNSKHQS